MVDPLQLAFLPRTDKSAMLDWLGYHGEWHTAIARKSVEQSVQMQFYDVYDVGDFNDWLYFHDLEHQNIAANFNTEAPPDLSYLNFENDVDFANWLQAHALIHDGIRHALGL